MTSTVFRQAILAAAVGLVLALAIAKSFTFSAFILLALVGIGILFLTPTEWGVIGLVGLLIFEGVLRKWLLPGAQDLIYFAKDGMVVILVVKTIFATRIHNQNPWSPSIKIAGILLLGWLGLQWFNPRNPSLALYFFGLRTYLLPFALLWVISQLQIDWAKKVAVVVVWSLWPLAILAFIQLQFAWDHPINQYVGWANLPIAEMGGDGTFSVRATSTFSYISGFAVYMGFATLLIPYVAKAQRWPIWISIIGVTLGIFGVIASGSRGPLIWVLGGLAFIGWPRWKQQPWSRKWTPFGMAFVMFLTMITVIPEPVDRVMDRFSQNADYFGRIADKLVKPVQQIGTAGLIGWGPGMMHQSRPLLLSRVRDWGESPPFVEEPIARVVLELGAPGALLWLVWLCTWLYISWRVRTNQTELHRGMFWFALFSTPDMLIYNVTNFYLFVIALGLILSIQTSAMQAAKAVTNPAT